MNNQLNNKLNMLDTDKITSNNSDSIIKEEMIPMTRQIMVMRSDTIPTKALINEIVGQGVKPFGGIWTASEVNNGQSSWSIWCSMNMPEWIRDCKRFALTIKADAKIFTIDSEEDMMILHRNFPGVNPENDMMFDWAAIAEVFDGVHLTDEGQWATRNTDPVSLHGWDMESTLWFRWVFEEVVELTEWDVEEMDDRWEVDMQESPEEFVAMVRESCCNTWSISCKFRCTPGTPCENKIMVDELLSRGGTIDMLLCCSRETTDNLEDDDEDGGN